MITVAKSAGFCFGVHRAVEKALETARNGHCITVGSIVHNRSVMAKLREQGVGYINDWRDAPPEATLIIRSHGLPRSEWEAIHARPGKTVDATCPCVARMHKLATESMESKRFLVVIGNKNHPEIRGVIGWCDGNIIVENDMELTEKLQKISPETPITVMAQTTTVRANWEKCVKTLKKHCTNVEMFDTICGATDMRQRESVELAADCDVMVVVGDRTSANTEKLVALCCQLCDDVIWVENAAQLPLHRITGEKRIGVTAGASTPMESIEEVVTAMTEEMINVNEGFEELLEQSIKTLSTGDRVMATVVAITPNEVQLELGAKHAGYIPLDEVSSDPKAKPEEVLSPGQEVEVFIVHVSDNEGVVLCSRKKIETLEHYDVVHEAVNAGVTLEGTVVEENNGGIVVSVRGVRVFVPASLSGVPRNASLSDLMNKTVKLQIIEYNERRRRFVGSIRAANNHARAEAEAKIWKTLAVGDEFEGTVKSMTVYGAFVDIGGIDGMVHVSELTWDRIHKPEDFCKIGDKLKVRVIKLDPERKKVSLSVKDPSHDPWDKFIETYKVNDVAPVTIMRMTAFGAFAELTPRVDGLIHISEIAHERIARASDVLKVGQVVDVRILHIDHEQHKVSLSIRATLEPPSAEKVDNSPDEVVASVDVEGRVDVPQEFVDAKQAQETADEMESVIKNVEKAETEETNEE